jgi:hypothetical protein
MPNTPNPKVPDSITYDPWADVQRETLAKAVRQMEIEATERRDAATRRHERFMWFLWVVGALIAAAVVGVVIYTVYRVDLNNNAEKIRVERERTQQIEACTSLEQPIERQYCLLGVGGRDGNDGR